jgi:hypothetical protein
MVIASISSAMRIEVRISENTVPTFDTSLFNHSTRRLDAGRVMEVKESFIVYSIPTFAGTYQEHERCFSDRQAEDSTAWKNRG